MKALPAAKIEPLPESTPPTEAPEAGRATGDALLLVGNPNVGKSVLFGLLTNTYVTVSNYPGTTIEISRGKLAPDVAGLGAGVAVLDTPGTNTLNPTSDDERVTRDILLASPGQTVVQVVDAKNLRRGLLLTLQLLELNLPTVVVLNMADEARARGHVLHTDRLAEALGVPVVETVAIRREGFDALLEALPKARAVHLHPSDDPAVVEAVGRAERLLSEAAGRARAAGRTCPSWPESGLRGIASLVVAGEKSLWPLLERWLDAGDVKALRAVHSDLQARYPESLRYVMNRARIRMAAHIADRVTSKRDKDTRTLATRLGNAALHPVWGIGILAVILYLTFRVVGVFAAGTAVDLLEHGLFGGPVDVGFDPQGVPGKAQSLTVAPDGSVSYAPHARSIGGSGAHEADIADPDGEDEVHVLRIGVADVGPVRDGARTVTLVAQGQTLSRELPDRGAWGFLIDNLVWKFDRSDAIAAAPVKREPMKLVVRATRDPEGLGLGDLSPADTGDAAWSGHARTFSVPADRPVTFTVRAWEGHINPAIDGVVSAIPWGFAQRLLVGPYGLVTVAVTYALAIILPIVFFFFMLFSLLEDSGYLPRLAVMVNRAFTFMGLNGKAVLPMILGLGCDTMATLTTRILSTPKERLLATILLTLAIPCTAQLGVITATAAAHPGVIGLFVAILLGVLVVVGWVGGKLLPGQSSDFILELPPIRRPALGNILRKTFARLEWYVKEAVPLFLFGTLLLFVLAETGALGAIQGALEPLTTGWLGLPKETANGFVLGFLRRDYGVITATHGVALTPNQLLVVLVTITLFVPCVAQATVTIKEQGARRGFGIFAFVMTFAFVAGGLLRFALDAFGMVLA